MSLIQITDELIINRDQISAITTGIETSSLNSRQKKDLITQGKNPDSYYELKPMVTVYINSHYFYVYGFADIYNLLSSTKYSRVWDNLLKKVIALKGNEDEIGLLCEEDMTFLLIHSRGI
jgi:hypothetical protein